MDFHGRMADITYPLNKEQMEAKATTFFVDDGVTAAKGYRAAGVEAGIKYAGRKDFALLMSDNPASVAAVFTTNQVAAAPVQLDRRRVQGGRAQVVAVNSGCANACTGEKGLADAKAMAAAAAEATGVDESLVLVCSTGVIGAMLPMDRIVEGAKKAAAALDRHGGPDAARAIMTTDTVDKQAGVKLTIDGREVVIGGMCKGSGMIEPNMATMLGFLTTDANVDPQSLDIALRQVVETTFNRVVVDGDRSTNDTVILMANGAAGNRTLTPAHPQWTVFVAALKEVAMALSRKLVLDGEGATKFVKVHVKGAKTEHDARLAARAISKSALVKTSWFGVDPNWGRVICAAGYSGATVDDQKAQIWYGDVCAYDQGRVADAAALAKMKAAMKGREFDVTVNLNLGTGEDTIYTCDFSLEYVKINADYTT